MVQSKTAVLSAPITRTGPWGARNTLRPARNYVSALIVACPQLKSKGRADRKAKKHLEFFEVHFSECLSRFLKSVLHFLCLYHAEHTVSAQDVDRPRGSHRLPAAGADQLPGAAVPPAVRPRAGSWLGRAAAPGADISVRAAHVNVLPPLGDDEINQRLRRLRDAPTDPGIIADFQITSFGGVPKPLVVVDVATGAVLDPELHILDVDQLMQ